MHFKANIISQPYSTFFSDFSAFYIFIVNCILLWCAVKWKKFDQLPLDRFIYLYMCIYIFVFLTILFRILYLVWFAGPAISLDLIATIIDWLLYVERDGDGFRVFSLNLKRDLTLLEGIFLTYLLSFAKRFSFYFFIFCWSIQMVNVKPIERLNIGFSFH